MNTILLDTHTLIWMVSEESRLGDYAKELVFEHRIRKFLSPATYWEIAIKMSLGKLELSDEFDTFISDAIHEYGLEILHIQPQHASALTKLDLFHKDPFDRMLIAQASVEGIPIVSVDKAIDPYPVERLWDSTDEQGVVDEEE